MADFPKRISWWRSSVLGGVVLSLVTLIGLPLKLVRLLFPTTLPNPFPGPSLLGFPVFIFGLGFVCGSVVWALQGLPRRLGPLGDAITGWLVMIVFFVCCMLVFDRPMLLGKAPGREPMLLLGSVVGLVLGVWVGSDLRRELGKAREE